MSRSQDRRLPWHSRASLGAAIVALAACGSDRGVPENIAGGYNGGGVIGLTGGCYLNSNPNVPNDGASVIAIDPKTRFQTMQGFGASVRLFDDPRVTNTMDPVTKRGTGGVPPENQQPILGTLYTDLGLTRVRFLPGEGGGIEPVNDNADPLVTDASKFGYAWNRGDGQLDLLSRVFGLGARSFFVAAPTPEGWMTESSPAEYTEWLLAGLRHWKDRGYEPPYVSLKNEPGSAASGGVWSAAFLRDVTKLLGARIKAEGLKTKIVLPDDVDAREAYARLQLILADADARQYVGAVAYHHRDPGGEAEVKQLAGQYDIPVWVTAYSAGGLMDASTTIHSLIADAGASAIDYAWAFSGDHESTQLVRLVASNGVYERFVRTPQYYATGQYARYVLPGAIRVAATSTDPNVKAVAFVQDFKLVVVVTHIGGPYERPIRLELGPGGPCVKQVTSVRSTDVDNWSILEPASIAIPRITATVPAHSITTFVGRE